jgi:hypothetical protein
MWPHALHPCLGGNWAASDRGIVMNSFVSNAASAPKKYFVVCSLVFMMVSLFGIAASGDSTEPKVPDPPTPPQNAVKAESRYSPSVTTIAVSYRTKRHPTTGVVTIVKGETSTKKFDIEFKKDPSSAAQPFDAILVSFQFSHKKETGNFTVTPVNTPVMLDRDHNRYRIDLKAFAQKFATTINSTLPPTFDPTTTDFDFKDAVEVIITPVNKSEPIIAAPINKGDPVTLGQKLTITFNPAIGDS